MFGRHRQRRRRRHRHRLAVAAGLAAALAASFVALLVRTELRGASESREREDRELAPLHGLAPLITTAATARPSTDEGTDGNGAREPEGTSSSNVTARWPPLESVVDGDGSIVGDPGFLLDFAVLGFGKCGTSTVMHWLAEHPQVAAFRREVWDLMWGQARPARAATAPGVARRSPAPAGTQGARRRRPAARPGPLSTVLAARPDHRGDPPPRALVRKFVQF
jgi:H+/Cl- antiporter ClcA